MRGIYKPEDIVTLKQPDMFNPWQGPYSVGWPGMWPRCTEKSMWFCFFCFCLTVQLLSVHFADSVALQCPKVGHRPYWVLIKRKNRHKPEKPTDQSSLHA